MDGPARSAPGGAHGGDNLVKIRLARKGNRKRPFYRLVVAEDSSRRDGRFIEIVGTYDPLKKPAATEVNSDAVLRWLSEGAQPSDTVKRILMKCGIWAHWRAVQAGTAELDGMTGKVEGTIERTRDDQPSKKAVTRIAEEKETEKAAAAEAKAKSEAAADEGSDATGEAAETADES